MEPNRKLIYLLWTVIAVLVMGTAAGGYLLVRHTNDIDQANQDLNDSNSSLRRQLQDAKATPTPTPTPEATPLATPEASPTPAATATPKPTATPKSNL